MKESQLTASERRERAQLAFERRNPGLPWPAHSAAVAWPCSISAPRHGPGATGLSAFTMRPPE